MIWWKQLEKVPFYIKDYTKNNDIKKNILKSCLFRDNVNNLYFVSLILHKIERLQCLC